MKAKRQPEAFYSAIINLFLKKNLPFMVGGTYALRSYIGIERETKDMDLFCPVNEYPKLLKAASEAGYTTEVLDQMWIAKVHDGADTVDIFFSEANGMDKVDDGWLQRARQGDVLGHQVKLMPVEEMIHSKSYIQHKERYDGADVVHLMLKFGKSLDWNVLKEKMEPNWELLFAHLINFIFVYPNEIENIPSWLVEEYTKRLQEKFRHIPKEKERVTRGLLISSQYKIAVEKWGYQPISPFFSKTEDGKNK